MSSSSELSSGAARFLPLGSLVDSEMEREVVAGRVVRRVLQCKISSETHISMREHAPFTGSGVVSGFLPLPFVVARTLRGGGCCWLLGVVGGPLALFFLLLRGLDSCARAQNLGLGGSWLRWLFGVRGMETAATSRCVGLGRVHLVHTASHRSPSVGYRVKQVQECGQRHKRLVTTRPFPHLILFPAPPQLLSGFSRSL